MSRNRSRYRIVVALGLLVVGLGLGANVSLANPKTVRPCVTPTDVNLNERYGVSDAIVAPFCTEVDSGRRWTVSNAWFMGPSFDSVPPGFVPAGVTPVEDFVAKLIAVKYVVDRGTNREKTYVFSNDEDLAIVEDGGFVIANPITLGALKPSSVGDHVVESYLLFNAMHCDGLGDVVEENCLDGEVSFGAVTFTVTPGHD
jgi:hypothetical protein